MKKKRSILTRLTAMLLAVFLLVGFVACNGTNPPDGNPVVDGGGNGDGNGGDNGDQEIDDGLFDYEYVDPYPNFTPILRFAVTSDIHLRENSQNMMSRERLAALYTSAYGYSESQTYNKLDGIFFVGDYTQNGSDAELTAFFNYVNANTKQETYARAILGNHEFWATGRYTEQSLAATFEKYLRYGGYNAVDERVVIGGYHFIFLNMDLYTDTHATHKFSDAKIAWLEEQLAIAAADDPTEKKPIFVFQHMPAAGTVVGSSSGASDDRLKGVFENYPQVVDFSGHSHRTVSDPRSIWQGSFTAINTGSLAYLGVRLAGHPKYDGNSGVVAVNNSGAWITGDVETSVRNGGLYYFVEIDANNLMRIKIYNILGEDFYGAPIYIDSIGDPEKFTYTDDRGENSETPYFREGDSLSTVTVTSTCAMLKIPQARCIDGMNNYRCEIWRGSEKVNTVYRLSCTYLGKSAPRTIDLPFTNLSPATTYTVRVYPVNYWGKVGEPLVTELKTPISNNDLTPDIFSLRLNADDTASNAIDGSALTKVGSVRVDFDADLDKNVATFSGNNCYTYQGFESYYEFMQDSFSFETYFYVNRKPNSGYVDIVSNQESGGFGFEYKSDGKVYFYCSVNGSYKKPCALIPVETFVHLVGTFDGKSVKIYLNGELMQSVSAWGKFTPPAYYSRYLCIGGDSGNNATGNNYMTGKIATANIYSSALTEAQIRTLYNAY